MRSLVTNRSRLTTQPTAHSLHWAVARQRQSAVGLHFDAVSLLVLLVGRK